MRSKAALVHCRGSLSREEEGQLDVAQLGSFSCTPSNRSLIKLLDTEFNILSTILRYPTACV